MEDGLTQGGLHAGSAVKVELWRRGFRLVLRQNLHTYFELGDTESELSGLAGSWYSFKDLYHVYIFSDIIYLYIISVLFAAPCA